MIYLTKPIKSPYQRSKKTTLQIMIELTIALMIVWLSSIVTSFVKLGSYYGIKAILLMLVSLFTTLICDVITTILKNKKDQQLLKKIKYDLIHNYSWVTSIIFTLLCPVWISYYVVIVGSIFSTLIVKNIFGGFGSNIFNPAAFGRIFIQLCFDLSVPSTLKNGVISGSTLTTYFNSTQQWLGSFSIDNYSVFDILIGNYFGTMGETFTILIFALGVVLILRNVIDFRIPLFYLGTISIISLIIALFLGFENPLLYLLYHLSLGGVMFGAVFMITDPVTTPSSPFGNCLCGIIAGFLTILFRIGTKSSEGVIYAIALINLLTPTIDNFITKRTNENIVGKYGVISLLLVSSIIINISVAFYYNGGFEINEINGIKKNEYDKISEYIKFDFMEDNDYEFAYNVEINNELLYSVEIYKDNKLDIKLNNSYLILDKNDNEIGVIYCVKEENISINTGGYISKKDAVVFVAFSINEQRVEGVNLFEIPFVNNNYEDKISSALENYDYINNNILDEEPNKIISGATYSATGIKEAINKAYQVFKIQYGDKV